MWVKWAVRKLLSPIIELTVLGRIQVGILFAAILGTVVSVGIVQQQLLFFLSLAFLLSNCIAILFTIVRENTYSFYALIIVLLEQEVCITLAAYVDLDIAPKKWMKWVVPGWSWLSLAVYALLQLIVRRSWGWHKYKMGIVRLELIAKYNRVLLLDAAVLLDICQSAYGMAVAWFVPCSECHFGKIIPVAYMGVCATSVVSALGMGFAPRRDSRCTIITCTTVSSLSLVYMIFFTQSAIRSRWENHRDDSKTRDELDVAVYLLVAAAAARVLLVLCVFRVWPVFGSGLAQKLSKQQPWLIGKDEAQRSMFIARSTRTSTATARTDFNVRFVEGNVGHYGGVSHATDDNIVSDDDSCVEFHRQKSIGSNHPSRYGEDTVSSSA